MGLETSVYINGLVPTNPTGTDGRAQGDDHIRLLKKTIRNTFPNINGPVTANQEQINLAVSSYVPRGCILMWTGNNVPDGWALCDGTNSTPDLRGRFVMAANAEHPLGEMGGTSTHAHIVNIGGTALTEAQLPPHQHGVTIGTNDTTGTGWGQASPGNSGGANSAAYTIATTSTGAGQVHTHGANSEVNNHIPPYLVLNFIMKL